MSKHTVITAVSVGDKSLACSVVFETSPAEYEMGFMCYPGGLDVLSITTLDGWDITGLVGGKELDALGDKCAEIAAERRAEHAEELADWLYEQQRDKRMGL